MERVKIVKGGFIQSSQWWYNSWRVSSISKR